MVERVMRCGWWIGPRMFGCGIEDLIHNNGTKWLHYLSSHGLNSVVAMLFLLLLSFAAVCRCCWRWTCNVNSRPHPRTSHPLLPLWKLMSKKGKPVIVYPMPVPRIHASSNFYTIPTSIPEIKIIETIVIVFGDSAVYIWAKGWVAEAR